MRLAVLADIHGNWPALEAVLADLAQHAPDQVYLAGDQINRCPWSREVVELCASNGWPAIRGNHEWILERLGTDRNRFPFTEKARFPDIWWTWEHLAEQHLEIIRSWHDDLRIAIPATAPIRMIHGIPGDPFVGFYPEQSDAEIEAALEPVEESVVIAAHTHRPLYRRAGRWEVINGGSVGMPYNGDPRAQYVILDWVNGWQATWRQVEYSLDRVAQGFVESGFLAECGAMAQLHLRTVLTGEPWSSDFGYWMRSQPPEILKDVEYAASIYLETHGPGRWAFLG
jgi:predicted phosphodiesterase